MAILGTYPDDSASTDSDKYLTYDSSGATKLTPASTLKSYMFPASGIGGTAIGSYRVNRLNNGSSTTETAAKIQSGWASGQPGVATGIALTITFPVAFTNIPIVVGTFGGDTAVTTSTLGSGGGNVKQSIVEVLSVSNTGCTLQVLTRDNTNYATNNTVYAHWIAIGT